MKLRKALSIAAIAAAASALLAGAIYMLTRTSCGGLPVWLAALCGVALALNIAVIALPAPPHLIKKETRIFGSPALMWGYLPNSSITACTCASSLIGIMQPVWAATAA